MVCSNCRLSAPAVEFAPLLFRESSGAGGGALIRPTLELSQDQPLPYLPLATVATASMMFWAIASARLRSVGNDVSVIALPLSIAALNEARNGISPSNTRYGVCAR